MIIPIEETIVPLPNVNEFIGELITLAQVLAENLAITSDCDDEDEQKISSFASEGNNTSS